MASVIYWGLFLDDDSVARLDDRFGEDSLEQLIDDPHITFSYHPITIDRTLLGRELTCTAVGYANNGRNQGIRVDLGPARPLCTKPIPHVTLSLAFGAAAKDTIRLPFHPLEPPIPLSGVICAYCSDGSWDMGD